MTTKVGLKTFKMRLNGKIISTNSLNKILKLVIYNVQPPYSTNEISFCNFYKVFFYRHFNYKIANNDVIKALKGIGRLNKEFIIDSDIYWFFDY